MGSGEEGIDVESVKTKVRKSTGKGVGGGNLQSIL